MTENIFKIWEQNKRYYALFTMQHDIAFSIISEDNSFQIIHTIK